MSSAIPTVPVEEKEDSSTKKAKWLALKDEFLSLCATGGKVHWPTLAAKYDKQPQTARNKASEEKWYNEIEERRKEREQVIEQKLTERTTVALDKLNDSFATSEVQIRTRHATIARGLQIRAVQRLKDIKMEDLTAKDCIALLQLGLREERFAMGLPEVAEQAVTDPESQPSEYKSVSEQVGGLKQVQKFGTQLLKALQNVDLSAEDVDVKPSAPPPAAPAKPNGNLGKRDVSDGSMQSIAKPGPMGGLTSKAAKKKVVIVKVGSQAHKKHVQDKAPGASDPKA